MGTAACQKKQFYPLGLHSTPHRERDWVRVRVAVRVRVRVVGLCAHWCALAHHLPMFLFRMYIFF